MKENGGLAIVLIVTLLLQAAYSGDSRLPSPTELVRRLRNPNERTRVEAERGLLSWKADAAEAILYATCREPVPDPNVVAATRRILTAWERDSWNDPQSAAAIDRFVELARDPRSTSGQDVPLGPNAAIPFATLVRVLDVTPDKAAAFLSAKPGITVTKDQYGFYGSICLGRGWDGDPKDWLYIANLARERHGTAHTNGRRDPLYMRMIHPLDSDTLVECFKFFRKSENDSFSLSMQVGSVSREALQVLQSYHGLTSFAANWCDDDITDEDWAACIAAWPNTDNLFLLASAGRKSLAAASRLEKLRNLWMKNTTITEADLEPFRNKEKLESLAVWNGETYIQYLNQQGTGKWQIEQADRNSD